jgi:hypothetical protein
MSEAEWASEWSGEGRVTVQVIVRVTLTQLPFASSSAPFIVTLTLHHIYPLSDSKYRYTQEKSFLERSGYRFTAST